MSSLNKPISEVIIDFSTDEPIEIKKQTRKKLEKIVFTPDVVKETLLRFISAKPNETIVWLTGVIKGDAGYVLNFWDCDLSHADFVSAQTNPEWMSKFSRNLAENFPTHNLVIEAHIHPIGSNMSNTDKEGLFALTTWSEDVYFCMIACDIPFGIYTVTENTMHNVAWEVIRWKSNEMKKSEILTNISTSKPSWAQKIMGTFHK